MQNIGEAPVSIWIGKIKGVVGRFVGRGRLDHASMTKVRREIRSVVLVGLAVLSSGALLSAQEPVRPATNVESLFKDNNKKLNDMKQVAYHIEKDLLQCGHWNAAADWLTERYIQHNPMIGSGRAAVVEFFGRNAPAVTCEKLNAPVVAVLADDDLVTVVTVANLKDSKGKAYTTTWFDMWRIVNGKADEHWDPMVKQ